MMIIGLDGHHLSDFDPKKSFAFCAMHSKVASGRRAMHRLSARGRLRFDNNALERAHANLI
ncbi:hypothetical protein KBK24_0105460 [Burkholderia sp. K24]|nr:hypothetical protein KBK24_0105460 [Burkholderia sp. K24]